jgi:hypothetical protein
VDAEPIRSALGELQGTRLRPRGATPPCRAVARPADGDDDALTEFAREHAQADLQALRALIRNARREIAAKARAARATRALQNSARDLSMNPALLVGLVSISDRASAGAYRDEGIPALKEWLGKAIASPAWRDETRLIPDEQPVIEATLRELVDASDVT